MRSSEKLGLVHRLDEQRVNSGNEERFADEGLIAAVAVAVVLIGALPYLIHGLSTPIGSDSPVYAWWTHAAESGLALAGKRPGAPALLLALGGGGSAVTPLIGGLGIAMLAATATSAAVVVRKGIAGEAGTLLGGVLVGVFATTMLAFGLLANLIVAALFLAAACLLIRGSKGTLILGTGLLAAAALAHPWFAVIGALTLVATAFVANRVGDPQPSPEGPRTMTALAVCIGAGIVGAIGLLLVRIGPAPIGVDWSLDGLLRSAGLSQLLKAEFRDRTVEWVSILWPWLVAGTVGIALSFNSAVRRSVWALVATWTALSIGAAAVAYASGLLPPHRLLFFALGVPLACALGLAARRASSAVGAGRAIGIVLAALVVFAVVSTIRSWAAAPAPGSAAELAGAERVARVVASTPTRTPVVVVMDSRPNEPFGRPAWANLVRAAVPSGRIADVYPFLGRVSDLLAGRSTARDGARIYSAISAEDFAAIPTGGVEPVVVLARPFTPEADGPPPPGFSSVHGVLVSGDSTAIRPDVRSGYPPTSPMAIVLASLAVLFALGLVGLGWALAAGLDRPSVLGLAPSIGAGMTILFAIGFDRVGTLGSQQAWWLCGLVAMLGGYALLSVKAAARRRSVAKSTPIAT